MEGTMRAGALLLAGALAAGCASGGRSGTSSDPSISAKGAGMEPAPELREIIVAWFEAAAKGDVSWRDRHVSRQPGTRIVGTDPEEFLEGPKAYEFLKNEAEAVGGKVTVTVGHVEAFKEGTVGWGVAVPTITLPDGKKVSPRWSAVFHKEGEQWKLVQLHASIPVTNAEALGDTFPGVAPPAKASPPR